MCFAAMLLLSICVANLFVAFRLSDFLLIAAISVCTFSFVYHYFHHYYYYHYHLLSSSTSSASASNVIIETLIFPFRLVLLAPHPLLLPTMPLLPSHLFDFQSIVYVGAYGFLYDQVVSSAMICMFYIPPKYYVNYIK